MDWNALSVPGPLPICPPVQRSLPYGDFAVSCHLSSSLTGRTPAFTPHAHLYPALNPHLVTIGWLACLSAPLG